MVRVFVVTCKTHNGEKCQESVNYANRTIKQTQQIKEKEGGAAINCSHKKKNRETISRERATKANKNTLSENMTWGAFLAAMRRGVSEKTGAAARRGGVQQANRAASTKAVLSVPPKKTPPIEAWDFMMLDVSIVK